MKNAVVREGGVLLREDIEISFVVHIELDLLHYRILSPIILQNCT